MFPGGGLHRSRLDYSDSYVPDCWPPSAGARVPPVGTTVHCARLDYSDFGVPDCVPELLESVRDTEESLLIAGDVALPEMSPVMFAGTAAAPVSLPAVAGDIVGRCRVWESHADLEDQGGWYPSPRWSLPIYMINDGGNAGHNLPGAADNITPAAQELLESLLQHLLPTPVLSPPKVTPIPSELELLIHRLIGNDRPVQPAPIGEVRFYRHGSVLIQKFASGRAVYVGAATPGARTPRLVVCGVFLV